MPHYNLMLIDDDEDDQEIFLTVLRKISPETTCITALNGKDGLEKLKLTAGKPDMIFLDLNMPLMNGKQFLLEVKKDPHFRTIPVIVLTTSSDKETMDETSVLGSSFFVTKPDHLHDWEKKLREILILTPHQALT